MQLYSLNASRQRWVYYFLQGEMSTNCNIVAQNVKEKSFYSSIEQKFKCLYCNGLQNIVFKLNLKCLLNSDSNNKSYSYKNKKFEFSEKGAPKNIADAILFLEIK